MNILLHRNSLLTISDDEKQAIEHVKCGQIDRAIEVYQCIKPDSPRILNIIGALYMEKKGDYDSAIDYFQKALSIQEKDGDDISSTLTELGVAYQKRREYDLALIYHCRALSIREMAYCADQTVVASSLIGIANAYWGQRNLSEALIYAKHALTLNESVKSNNDLNIATNLAILANIYHNLGDDIQALQEAIRALTVLENCALKDLSALATLLNNIGVIQLGVGLYTDARLSFARAMEIYEKTLPEGHPIRVLLETNVQRITHMAHGNNVNSFLQLRNFLSKILLF